MDVQLLLVATPIAIGLLARLTRRSPLAHTDVVRSLRDLLTLRMVLRDSSPKERMKLLAAHRRWRVAEPGRRARP